MDDNGLATRIRSLAQWRAIFALLAIVVPGLLYMVFERQARRLDALGDHGEVTTATVTRVQRGGRETYVVYAYTVGGAAFTWSAAHADAPYDVGQSFAITYLPEHPALSRPGPDRARATAEAASNRSFASKVVIAVFAFFALNLALIQWRLRGLRRHGTMELTDPRSRRARLIASGALLLPILVAITGFHARDALERGESVWPVLVGAILTVAVLAGTALYVLREGHTQASARSARLLKWVAPIAAGIAALRAMLWLAGWN